VAWQVLRECMAWGRGQFVALVIAVLSAWAALRWGLVPIAQTRAAYVAYLWPFVAALVGYLIVQIGRAPYVLDREQQQEIKKLEKERNELVREREVARHQELEVAALRELYKRGKFLLDLKLTNNDSFESWILSVNGWRNNTMAQLPETDAVLFDGPLSGIQSSIGHPDALNYVHGNMKNQLITDLGKLEKLIERHSGRAYSCQLSASPRAISSRDHAEGFEIKLRIMPTVEHIRIG